MKKTCLSLLLFLSVIVTRAVTITQINCKALGRTTNQIVWTTKDESNDAGYIIERNGEEVWYQEAGHNGVGYENAGYYFIDDDASGILNLYTIKAVDAHGNVEATATGYVINLYWRRFLWR